MFMFVSGLLFVMSHGFSVRKQKNVRYPINLDQIRPDKAYVCKTVHVTLLMHSSCYAENN